MAIKYLSGERVQGIKGTAVPASTGWTLVSGMALTSGTGITVTGTNQNYSYYDLGTTVPCTNNMVIDYDVTRTSGDYYDHPMLTLRNVLSAHNDVSSNGDSKILLLYWANGDTSDGDGGAVSLAQFYDTSRTELQLGDSSNGYRQASGTTRYYRFYISKSGDDVRDIRWSAWTTDANRTAEGATGREFDLVQGTALGSNWLTSDDLRYLIVENKNGQVANWIVSNLKIWSNVQSDGIADNMLSHTPTHTFNFTDVPAVDEKATVTNAPIGSRFEETDTMAIYRYGNLSRNWTDVYSKYSIVGNKITRTASSNWDGYCLAESGVPASSNPTITEISGGNASSLITFTWLDSSNNPRGVSSAWDENVMSYGWYFTSDYSNDGARVRVDGAIQNCSSGCSGVGHTYTPNVSKFKIEMTSSSVVFSEDILGNGSWSVKHTSNAGNSQAPDSSKTYYMLGNVNNQNGYVTGETLGLQWRAKGTA